MKMNAMKQMSSTLKSKAQNSLKEKIKIKIPMSLNDG
jgi:hypothetical protein